MPDPGPGPARLVSRVGAARGRELDSLAGGSGEPDSPRPPGRRHSGWQPGLSRAQWQPECIRGVGPGQARGTVTRRRAGGIRVGKGALSRLTRPPGPGPRACRGVQENPSKAEASPLKQY